MASQDQWSIPKDAVGMSCPNPGRDWAPYNPMTVWDGIEIINPTLRKGLDS